MTSARVLYGTGSIFWNYDILPLSEENIGIDRSGIWVKRGSRATVVVHGGGLLTAARTKATYESNPFITFNPLKESEFGDLLRGRLPDGTDIKMYSIEDAVRGNIKNPYGRYGVVLSSDDVKDGFLKNPLVVALAGTPEYLERYCELTKLWPEPFVPKYSFAFSGKNRPLHLLKIGIRYPFFDQSFRFCYPNPIKVEGDSPLTQKGRFLIKGHIVQRRHACPDQVILVL